MIVFPNQLGAWKMLNDKMGGTFVNYAFLSKNNKEIINVDGYVYAPNFEKSKLIRELEAIIYSSFNKWILVFDEKPHNIIQNH